MTIRKKFALSVAFLLTTMTLYGLYLLFLYFQFESSLSQIDEQFQEIDVVTDLQALNATRINAAYSYDLNVFKAISHELTTLLTLSFVEEIQTLDPEGEIVLFISEAQLPLNEAKEKKFSEFLNILTLTAEEEIDAAIYKNKQKLLTIQISLIGIIFLILIFVLLFFYLFSSYVTRSIESLASTARAIAAGDLRRRMQINSHDEFGDFAQAFNQMADHLSESHHVLAATVQEKTLELGQKISDIQKKNQEFRDVQAAMTNVLEDLEVTKGLIEEEKAKDDAILASIGDGLIATDESGNIILFNHSASRLLHVDAKESLGKVIEKIFLVTDEGGHEFSKDKNPFHQVLSSDEKVRTSQYYLKRLDGSVFPVSMALAPIESKGSVRGCIMVFRDITQEKAVDRMKNEFISLASHQLRTPLTAMKWFSEMLIQGTVGELKKEQKDVVSNIHSSNERMIELVESLLNISRLESGRIVLDPTPTALESLLAEVLVELEPRITVKRQKLSSEIAADLPLVNVDPKLVRQVLSNLIGNAVKYTPEGGQVAVRLSVDEKNLRFEVKDSGIGIPKDEQDRVFEKFFRADNTNSLEVSGTGLGLYLVKLLVSEFQGDIGFESTEGSGTKFWFTLPLKG